MAAQAKRVVIVGGGPAGMMLAYQLVSNGIGVRVLERHPDFDREFRGELLQRSVVDHLQGAGIFPLLLERGLALPDIERRMFLGHARRVRVPGGTEAGAVVNQPAFLRLLHELCSAYPGYELVTGCAVNGAVVREGRVVSLQAKQAGQEVLHEGDLFVVCNGRNSPLRKACGLSSEVFAQTADALWLRFDFSDQPSALPKSVDVHMFGRGVVTVLQPSSANRLHLAYSAPGELATLRKDLPELKRRLLPTLSGEVRRGVEAKLTPQTESQVLKIIVDRVTRWHAPGVLFLGDAAHTMSPSGGAGLNVALRDTFVAANHLIPVLLSQQPVDEKLLQRIQDERQAEIEAIQARQTRSGQMVLKPLPALHVLFTILRAAMAVFGKKMAGGGALLPTPKYLTPVGSQTPG